MELNGTQFIAAPKDVVWRALNNLQYLRQSIPGCDTLEEVSENTFRATVRAKIGPVSAAFVSSIQLSEIEAPNSYVISGEGQGVAGFGGGRAVVRLIEANGGTDLTYAVTASVGGKLAQIGSRLIDAAAAKLANEFFGKFEALITADRPAREALTIAQASSVHQAHIQEQEHEQGQVQGEAEDQGPGYVQWFGRGRAILIAAITLLAGLSLVLWVSWW